MKYLKKFSSLDEANTQGCLGLYSPQVNFVSGYDTVNITDGDGVSFFACEFDSDGKMVKQKNNEIWYISSNGSAITPVCASTSTFGASITSNTYNDVKGRIQFDGYVTSIGSHTFFKCSTLSNISIPDSVTSIGEHAFFSCTTLSDISIPDSVTIIKQCSFGKSGLKSITIGSGVITIADYVFSGCTSLTGVTIPDNVTTIGFGAFNRCSYLKSVTIGNGVTGIGNYAFYNCLSLTGVTIPDSVTSIGNYIFYGCSNLTGVTIPDSVTSIGYRAFYGCYRLTSFTCKAITPPSLDSSAFTSCPSAMIIYVPSESVDAYKAATNWSARADYIQAIPS